ncbi:hypothetical protein GCM10011613_16420 [Cellvibrio zantedeschiae]|uniref:Ice-binding protein C-terminal domain-containing protein n=1 Tax=Cellvibrio zantedeschiae TaxID=1237077 RepID=A0ABQ3B1X9_9GAMM|nr:PEP-CTERM sorting domain-containing protein [Cellvibrio zantedeschiae]GGY72181.1 hypothetical protein GCM10011613_16420 [Cellvibrio zantedeschiae]
MDNLIKFNASSLLAVLIISFATSANAGLLSFAATRDSSLPLDEYNNWNYTYTHIDTQTDGSIASSSILSGNAKAQSAYGVNRISVSNNAAVDDADLREHSIGGPFATAISIWSDTFTITGGTGSGKVSVSANVSGQFGMGYGAAGIYRLFKASPQDLQNLLAKPFEFLVDEPLLNKPWATPDYLLDLGQDVINLSVYDDPEEHLQPGSTFGKLLTTELDFNYDDPFTLVSILAGSANDFGSLSAFNSAHFGISGPENSIISTTSNSRYNQAAVQVPEPGSFILLTIGSLLLLMRRKSQKNFLRYKII